MDYKLFFIIAATLALFLSLMLLMAPKMLIKTGEVLNKDFDTSTIFTSHRKLFGALTTILGLIILYFTLWN